MERIRDGAAGRKGRNGGSGVGAAWVTETEEDFSLFLPPRPQPKE